MNPQAPAAERAEGAAVLSVGLAFGGPGQHGGGVVGSRYLERGCDAWL